MRKIPIFVYVASLVFCYSCSSETEEPMPDEEIYTAHFTAEAFYPSSRTFIDKTTYSVSWCEDDLVGIFPETNGGRQMLFEVKNHLSSNEVVFTGGGWGLKAGTLYYAYYPFVADYQLDKQEILLNYTGQKQQGNGNLSHLSPFDYMTAISEYESSGSLNFEFKHLGSLLHLQLQMPVTGTFTKIALRCGEGFIAEAKLNLTKNEVMPVKRSATMTLDLNEVTLTNINTLIDAYLFLSPVNLSGKDILVTITDKRDKSYYGVISGTEFKASEYKDIHLTMSKDYPLSITIDPDESNNFPISGSGFEFN